MTLLKTFVLAAAGLVTLTACHDENLGRVNDDSRKLSSSAARIDSIDGKAFLQLVTETRKDSTVLDTVFYELLAQHDTRNDANDSTVYRLGFRDGIGKTSIIIASKDTLRMIEYKDKETAASFVDQITRAGKAVEQATGDTAITRDRVFWQTVPVKKTGIKL